MAEAKKKTTKTSKVGASKKPRVVASPSTSLRAGSAKQPPRQTHTIDATDKAPGRIATEISILLRGKHKPTYLPYLDRGDFVTITNAAKMKLTGTKRDTKVYYHHSGYPGGLKEKKLSEVFDKNPAEVLERTVWNMLPKNKLRKGMFKRLKITN